MGKEEPEVGRKREISQARLKGYCGFQCEFLPYYKIPREVRTLKHETCVNTISDSDDNTKK